MVTRLFYGNRTPFRPGPIRRRIRDARATGEHRLWRPLLNLPGEFVAVYLCRRAGQKVTRLRCLNYVIRSPFFRRKKTLREMQRVSVELPSILHRLELEGRPAGYRGRLYFFRFFILSHHRSGDRGKNRQLPATFLFIARRFSQEQMPDLKTLEEFGRLLYSNGVDPFFPRGPIFPNGAGRVSGNPVFAEFNQPCRKNSLDARYLASIAHDIRMPLAGALLTVDRLEKEISASPACAGSDLGLQSDIHRLRNYLTSAENLANDFLQLEVAASRVGGVREKFRGGDVISAVLHSQQQLLVSKRTEPVLMLSREDYLQTDRIALERILYNLISNCARFCSVPGRIRIETEKKNGLWIVEIEDNGPGMTASDLELAGQNVGRGGSGWGIGLYSAMKQCERLGGFFSIPPPRFLSGCRFLLVLPDGLNQVCTHPGKHTV